jgi:hypothetical protein
MTLRTSSPRQFAAAAVFLCLAGTGRAVELRVVPELKENTSASGTTANFTFRPVHVGPKDDADARSPVRVLLPLDHAASVELAPGQWSLDVDNAGWWHARQYVSVSEATGEIVVPLWPSAEVTGSVALRDGTIPKDVTIRFSSPREVATAASVAGEATCPVMDKRFRCRVAAAILDLRIRSKGCIAHYAWGSKLAPSAPLDVGAIVFDRGAAITGMVALGRGVTARMESLRAKAVPEGVDRAGNRLLQFLATPAPKGFFHIDGVPPGQYVVTVEGPGRIASSPVRVSVVGDVEAQLRQPLLADVPRALTVDVLPPLDPEQRPWVVTLDHQVTERYYETVSQGRVDSAGAWSAHVQPGRYALKFSSPDGARWASRDVDVNADTHLVVPLTTRSLHGRVLLGTKPLTAKLLFGGEFGSQVIPTQSDEHGSFEVRLPNPDVVAWDVTINAAAPRVKRTMHVTLPANADDETLLQLRDTIVMGTVVDDSGKPVGREVTVNMARKDELIQVDVDDDGSFAFHGVDPGPYTLQAEGFLLQSDAIEFTVPEDSVPDALRVVVKPVHKVVGRVVSELGPVAGAQVTIVPADVSFVSAANRQTNERGEFSTTVPSNCQRIDVFVAAPGFAYKAFRTTLRADSMLNIPVDQRGGALTARWPTTTTGAVLFHAGAMIWPDSLVWQWSGQRKSAEGVEELISAPLDPGVYTLCLLGASEAAARKALTGASDSRCVDTFLPPFGDVVLQHP